MKQARKVVALLLSLLLVVGILPVTAMATETSEVTAEVQGGPVQTPAVMSLLPLDETEAYCNLNGYLPDELKDYKVSDILDNLTEYNGTTPITIDTSDVAVWTKYYYYDENGDYVSENDDFVAYDSSATIDLSYRYNNRVEMELIVGTNDPLDPANDRYIVYITLENNYAEILIPTVKNTSNGSINVLDTNSGQYTEGGNYFHIDVDKEDWSQEQQATLSFALNPAWAGHANTTIKIYDGEYTSTDELAGVVPITEKTAYFGRNTTDLTVAFEREGNTVAVVPFNVYMYQYGISVSGGYSLYADVENSYRTYVDSSSDYDWNNGQEIHTIMLDAGYLENAEYYVEFQANGPDYNANNGIAHIQRAVVGDYTNAAAINAQPDIKNDLFGDAYDDGGYKANFSNGVAFTILDTYGDIHRFLIKVIPYNGPDEVLSDDTYFRIYGTKDFDSYEVTDANLDSYCENGYQTVFLLDNNTPVTADTITPYFSIAANSKIYASPDGTAAATEQKSGETAVAFTHGKAVHYTDTSESQTASRNYWVTFLTQQTGAKLFVQATNVESHYDATENIPVRQVFLKESTGNKHDILYANIGDAQLEGLSVELIDAQNVKLDDYWTITETKTLAPFTTTDKTENHGELPNLGKIRLVPDGAGSIGGKLKISSTNGGSVTIKLTGFSGDLKITTETLSEGVKYVPFSNLIQTNSMNLENLTFSLQSGKLPAGVKLLQDGEVYGIPTETGTFTFTVKATASYGEFKFEDSKEFTLTVKENTDANVEAVNTDGQGYPLLDRVTADLNVSELDEASLIFRSEGAFNQFMAFYLDGKKLNLGTDYLAVDGSTKITIQAQTLKNLKNGTHTLAAEFRTDGTPEGDLKRTAQNINVSGNSSSSGSSVGGSSYGQTSHTITSTLTNVTVVKVDGKVVDSKYYTTYGGNVTLSAEFMATLTNGTHTIRLENDTRMATGTFTVSGNYVMLEGKGQHVAKNATATFRSSAPYNKFVGVEVDGYYVSSAYYTSKSGSTVVTLSADYISTLADGVHTMTIVSSDGSATASFVVGNAVISAPTADAGIASYVVAAVSSTFSMAGAVYVTSRKRKED